MGIDDYRAYDDISVLPVIYYNLGLYSSTINNQYNNLLVLTFFDVRY